jgi:hypothetical protein
MQFAPFTLQVLDWHTVAAVVEVQPPVLVEPPFVVPHWPFVPQMFVTHSFAFAQVVVTLGPAQVFVTALHWPLVHTKAAVAAEQMPSWRPSFGIATPFDLSSTHVRALRSQCFVAGQSAST